MAASVCLEPIPSIPFRHHGVMQPCRPGCTWSIACCFALYGACLPFSCVGYVVVHLVSPALCMVGPCGMCFCHLAVCGLAWARPLVGTWMNASAPCRHNTWDRASIPGKWQRPVANFSVTCFLVVLVWPPRSDAMACFTRAHVAKLHRMSLHKLSLCRLSLRGLSLHKLGTFAC